MTDNQDAPKAARTKVLTKNQKKKLQEEERKKAEEAAQLAEQEEEEKKLAEKVEKLEVNDVKKETFFFIFLNSIESRYTLLINNPNNLIDGCLANPDGKYFR